MDQQPNVTPETPITQTPTQTPTPTPTPPPNNNKRYLIIGAGALLVIIVVVIALLFSGKKDTKDQNKTAAAPTLTVGSHPYLYACNALTRDDIKKAGATLRDDKGGEAVTSTQAIPYDQTSGGNYDLAKTIEDPLLLGVVTSKCDYLLSNFTSFDQKHIAVSINQYPSTETAQKVFKTHQTSTKGTPFASFKNTSLVDNESSSRDDTVTATILLGNRVVELKYSIGNATPDNASTKLDGLATTIVHNLSNTATATKPHDFSNLGSIGSTKLIDACHALDFKKADGILGGLHYEQASVTNDYKYGKISENSPAISAQCSVHFRYAEDDAKQPDYKSESYKDTETRFPSQLVLSVASYPNANEAANAVLGLKKIKASTAVDFAYGNTSFAYTQSSNTLGFPTTAHNFMTVKGGSVITVSVIQGEVTKPYTSTVKTVTTDQAKQLLDSLNLK